MEESNETSIYSYVLQDPIFAEKIMFLDGDKLTSVIYPYWESLIAEQLGKDLGEKAKTYFLNAYKDSREELWEEGHYYSFSSFQDIVIKAREVFLGKIIKNPKAKA